MISSSTAKAVPLPRWGRLKIHLTSISETNNHPPTTNGVKLERNLYYETFS